MSTLTIPVQTTFGLPELFAALDADVARTRTALRDAETFKTILLTPDFHALKAQVERLTTARDVLRFYLETAEEAGITSVDDPLPFGLTERGETFCRLYRQIGEGAAARFALETEAPLCSFCGLSVDACRCDDPIGYELTEPKQVACGCWEGECFCGQYPSDAEWSAMQEAPLPEPVATSDRYPTLAERLADDLRSERTA